MGEIKIWIMRIHLFAHRFHGDLLQIRSFEDFLNIQLNLIVLNRNKLIFPRFRFKQTTYRRRLRTLGLFSKRFVLRRTRFIMRLTLFFFLLLRTFLCPFARPLRRRLGFSGCWFATSRFRRRFAFCFAIRHFADALFAFVFRLVLRNKRYSDISTMKYFSYVTFLGARTFLQIAGFVVGLRLFTLAFLTFVDAWAFVAAIGGAEILVAFAGAFVFEVRAFAFIPTRTR